MKFQNKELTISGLLELINKRKIDLQPPYQRNFIWTNKDQQLLIDSILKGYPLPSFFVYKRNNGSYEYEMVDGQQRAETISRFAKGLIKSFDKKSINDINKDSFYQYKLNFIELYDLDLNKQESVEEFYYLVNKRGIRLNPNEADKAYYHNSAFTSLVNELMSMQDYIDLNIFSEKVINRMRDRGLVEELVSYLFRGITDKRITVENLFESDDEVNNKRSAIKNQFCSVLKKMSYLNGIKPINQTRYAQRNDFYTLFCFLNEHTYEIGKLLEYQYETLLFFDKNGFIAPSNEKCKSFKEYAINCVSQSNSKIARTKRLNFFNDVLCNENRKNNDVLMDIEFFLSEYYNIDSIEWITIDKFEFVNLSQFK